MVALAIVLLPVNAAAEDLVLLKPPPEFSHYQLSLIRLETDRFSNRVIVVQWRRTSVGNRSGWPKYGESWDCKITREQLLVDPETMQRLRGGRAKRKPAHRAANPPDILSANPPDKARTWTDRSGKFSVQAEFVSLEDKTVLMRNEAGKQMKIPLSKLQDKDQQAARKLQEAKASENPFEFVD